MEWQMTYKEIITHDRVNQLFSYNPETGELLRKKSFGDKKIGSIARYKASDKRLRVKVDKYFLYAGPLIYFIMTGTWPIKQIRHKNGNSEDFRWSNLQIRPEPKPYIKTGRKPAKKQIWKCEGCGFQEERIGYKNKPRYCGPSCQHKHDFEIKYEKWLNGENLHHDRRLRKRALVKRDGYKCATCNISEWNGKEITFEIEHCDGNSENNHPSNLELICPNCHSQTGTYKGRNRGNGRHARRQRYAEGKSY